MKPGKVTVAIQRFGLEGTIGVGSSISEVDVSFRATAIAPEPIAWVGRRQR